MKLSLSVLLYISLCMSVSSVLAGNTQCGSWPQGMVFVGLTDLGWETYVVTNEGGQPQKIDLNTEARTPLYSPANGFVIYLDSAGRVNQFLLDQGESKVLLPSSDQATYAQPEINEAHNTLYLVEFKQGKSVDTDIIQYDLDSGNIKPVVTQRSAQFEPWFVGDWLYYSNVHCVVGCGKIIQEVWRYHVISGIAEQVTLLNAISRQPFVDEGKSWLYFSSNVSGNYHIYRQSLLDNDGRLVERLTEGEVTDMSPSIHQGRLYFIRHNAKGVEMMCRDARDGELHAMTIPSGIKDIRDLEIH